MKTYTIRLHVGKIDLGTYEVKAFSKENAYEMAWELAELDFWAEED